MQTGQFARAAALLLLAQIRTAAGRVGVAIQLAGQLQEEGAGGIVAVPPFFGIGGGKEGAREAHIDRRTDQPTQSPLDLALRREFDRARLELVVG